MFYTHYFFVCAPYIFICIIYTCAAIPAYSCTPLPLHTQIWCCFFPFSHFYFTEMCWPSFSVYFFYQAADGRRIFLHPINEKCLAHEYGSGGSEHPHAVRCCCCFFVFVVYDVWLCWRRTMCAFECDTSAPTLVLGPFSFSFFSFFFLSVACVLIHMYVHLSEWQWVYSYAQRCIYFFQPAGFAHI